MFLRVLDPRDFPYFPAFTQRTSRHSQLKSHEQGKIAETYDKYEEALKHDVTDCFWICVRRDGKLWAHDIWVREAEAMARSVQKINWWGLRWSCYGVVDARPVSVTVLHRSFDGWGIEVREAEREADSISHEIKSLQEFRAGLPGPTECFSCGIDIFGKDEPACRKGYCANSVHDGEGDLYCPIYEGRVATRRIQWLDKVPALIQSHWKHGNFSERGYSTLLDADHIYSYTRFTHVFYLYAQNPNGIPFRSIEFVKGWRRERFFMTILLLILLPLCMAAVVGATTRSFATASAAASYAFGIVPLFQALITVFSICVDGH